MSIWRSYVVPQWVDLNGTTFRPYCTTYPQTDASLGPWSGLLSAMQAMSACTLEACVIQSAATIVGSGGSSPFPTAQDKLLIQVENGVNTGYVAIPGPLASLFESDTVTLNMSDSLVVALVNEILSVLGDGQGGIWTRAVGGKRVRVNFGPGTYK